MAARRNARLDRSRSKDDRTSAAVDRLKLTDHDGPPPTTARMATTTEASIIIRVRNHGTAMIAVRCSRPNSTVTSSSTLTAAAPAL